MTSARSAAARGGPGGACRAAARPAGPGGPGCCVPTDGRALTATRRWRSAHRIARLAGYGGGAAAALSAVAVGVVLGQAQRARRIIPLAEAPPPRCDGVYGAKQPGPPVTLVLLGDSSAAGYGVHRPRETPGALLATGLSRRLGRPVRLRRLAVVGAVSAGLAPQVEEALEAGADLAVILIGANDVTHRADQTRAVRHLVDAVRRLRAEGTEVVVGTCPDLGAIASIKPPLRWVLRHWSRQLAAAQTIAAVAAGARTVSLADLVGPRFAAEPHRMFSWDRFHPSAEGYATAVAAVLPTALVALGAAADQDAPLAADEGVRALPRAAHEAARHGGTEVSPAQVAGRDRGPAGRWAQLRRRAWFGYPRAEDPTVLGEAPDTPAHAERRQ